MAGTGMDGLNVVEIPTCCGTAPVPARPAGQTKFHFALNVSNLEKSIAFYRVLFDAPPAKHHHDYAKFELSEPPLVFSLVPNPPASGGSLSHFGFPVGSTAEVEAAAARLAAAGLEISSQDGTVCGYAPQDKIWIADPDRNFWEIYVVHEDVDPELVRAAFDGISPSGSSAPSSLPTARRPTVWEHRVLMPRPERIPHDDGTVDEVRLEGTFNDDCTVEQRARLLSDAIRVLRPGGRLAVHGLVASAPLDGKPELPGVAALVRQVPLEADPQREIAAAGFEAIRITKLPESPVFRHGPVEMREIKLEAQKRDPTVRDDRSRMLLYKGPFPAALDEGGQTFQRGARTRVTQATFDRLAAGAAASQFLFFDDQVSDSCGSG